MNKDNYSVVQTLHDLDGIIENLLLLLSDKEKVVIKKRFNLANEGKHTLESIGQEFSVTRERIRQIENNALNKMRRNVFNTALKNLHEFVGSYVRTHGGLFRQETLVKDLLALSEEKENTPVSAINLSLVLHEGLESIGNTINFHPYLRVKDIKDQSVKHASNHLVNQLHKHGDVRNIEKIHHDSKDYFKNIEFNINQLKSLVDIDKRLTLLDDALVALCEWRHIHPRTLRDKIMYILRNNKKPLHFAKISEKIIDANFDNKNVNVQAVHNELIRHDSFVLIGRGIYAMSEWGYERGTVADVIEKILLENGESDMEDIIAEVLKKRQVKKITIQLALKNIEKFERVGRKRYVIKS